MKSRERAKTKARIQENGELVRNLGKGKFKYDTDVAKEQVDDPSPRVPAMAGRVRHEDANTPVVSPR